MKLFISSDSNSESKISKVLDEWTSLGIRKYFENRDYGDGISCVSVIFMCRDPSLNFKRRIIFHKKDKTMHLDVMLDLTMMKNATADERKIEFARRIYDEVPKVLLERKIPNFDDNAFISDFKAWIDKFGWR